MQASARSSLQTSEQLNRRVPSSAQRNDLPPGVFPTSPLPAVNVASVAQRSPLRYPGGKTWLIPHIKRWLTQATPKPRVLIEPFCGGGIVSLTAVMEKWTDRCLMLEVDRDVAAFWHAALGHGQALADRVVQFELTRAAVNKLTSHTPKDVLEHGFRTLVLNRTRRGGVLAPGAAFTKVGENGKGLGSRWYPETIAKRLQAIMRCNGQIGFLEGDAMTFLEGLLHQQTGVAVFLDPPYTAGGKKAGKRLYAHHTIDHARLFELMDSSGADFLMTYDESPEIVDLIDKYGFHAVRVMMKNGHHNQIAELVITPRVVFA